MKALSLPHGYWVTGLCIAVVSAGFAAERPPKQEVTDDQEVRTLVKQKLDLANRALDRIDRSRKIGESLGGAAGVTHVWSYRRLSARLYLSFGPGEIKTLDPEVYLSLAQGPPNPERIAAFEEHRDLVRSWESAYTKLARTGMSSQLSLNDYQSLLLQTEIWLARERNRKPGERKP